MKKLITLSIMLLSISVAYSQSYLYTTTSSNWTNNDISHMGKLSLGTTTPDGTFTIYENGIPSMMLSNNYGRFQIGMANAKWNYHAKAKAGTVVLRNLTSHHMILCMPNNSNDGSRNIRIADDYNHNTFVVHNNGKITIGSETYDSDDYSLYVTKGIKTEKIKVEFADVNGWADYVFSEDYNLMPLNQVEEFIEENNHLPEIPSAEDVVESGVEIKAMNVLLLKKIEELTLHVIDLNKKLQAIEATVNQEQK